MPSDVGLIAQAVSEIAKIIGNWQVSHEKARLLYRIEAATQYVFVANKEGEYKEISDDRQKKLLLHFRKRIFDSN